ncbi:unnamed protein product [Moneuplotes crassus]|uniref:RCC1-like domain-containing protein n=1 Tax=Euplotes crassus TaxID=5936 RepID=A0AAD1Y9A4_EUPCR|nr:unnamed protein product [Moneuplotes crassus]
MSVVLTYGSGECEQLGLENCPIEIKKPRIIPFFKAPIKIKEIACGGMHTVLLTTQGRVYTWGCNDEGALGREGEACVPEIVTGLGELMTGVTCGDSHSIAYNTNLCQVYSWGLYRNSVSGPIGNIAKTPMRVGEGDLKGLKLKKIVSGSHHTLMLASGRVFAWGDPESGKIGRNIKTRRRNESGLTMQPVGLKRVKDIFCSRNASFAISEDSKENKNLYSWGLNNWGQLGLGHNQETSKPEVIKDFKNKNVLKVTGGDSHTVILVEEETKEGGNNTTRIYTVGLNDEGQLGIGDTYSEYRRNKNETNFKLEDEERKIREETEKKVKEIKEQDTDSKAKQKEINKTNNELKKRLKAIEAERNSLDNSEDAQYFTTAQLVEGITDAFDISAGANYSYAIRQRKPVAKSMEEVKGEESKEVDLKINQLYSWGMGDNYVLCNKDDETVYTPTEVKVNMFRDLNPISVSCGTMHCIMRSIALDEKPEDYGLDPITEKSIEEVANDVEKEIDENRTKEDAKETTQEIKPEKKDLEKVEEAKTELEKAEDKPKETEAKLEPKPEPKAEAKPEAKQESKPEANPEPKPESKPDSKPEPKPDSKPEPKPEAKPEEKPETKIEEKKEENEQSENIQKQEKKNGEKTTENAEEKPKETTEEKPEVKLKKKRRKRKRTILNLQKKQKLFHHQRLRSRKMLKWKTTLELSLLLKQLFRPPLARESRLKKLLTKCLIFQKPASNLSYLCIQIKCKYTGKISLSIFDFEEGAFGFSNFFYSIKHST